MKNLYPKNKGKVYPSPSSSSSTISSSPPPPPSRGVLSILNILPAAILALVTVLSLEDREVLAYMITRSMKTTSPSLMIEEKNKCKRSNSHNPSVFECGCFDCYTTYWFRWDSSPNRELIHQAIEAFEEHLTNGELSKKNNGRGKKKDKVIGKLAADKPGKERILVLEKEVETPESHELEPSQKADPPTFDNDLKAIVSDRDESEEEKEEELEVKCKNRRNLAVAPAEEEMKRVPASDRNHKGLARKFLPDVLGLFNSHLWRLWSPSV